MPAPRLNVETNLRGVAGKLNQRKNWINGKFPSAILSFWVQKGHSSFPSVGTLVSAITENGKNGRSTPKTHPRAKLPIADPPKVWVSGFLSVNGNAKLVSAITENGKNGRSALKTHPRAKLPITDPPKVWVSGFLSVDGNTKLVSAITENGKNGRSTPKMRPRAKLPITDPP